MNPLVNFNFMLRVEAVYDLPCKSVKAFAREMEYELIQEGGLNDYVHMRRKPISKPFTIEVERYVGSDWVDPLPNGAELLLPVVLFVNHAPQFVTVQRTYVFTGCTVIKKLFGELDGERSGLLVETTTIAYREMLCVDLPWSRSPLDDASPPPPGLQKKEKEENNNNNDGTKDGDNDGNNDGDGDNDGDDDNGVGDPASRPDDE